MWSESTRTLTYIHLNQPSNCVCIWTVEEGSMHLEESNNIDWGSLPRSSDGGIVIVENYVLFYKVRMMNNRFIFSFLFLNHHHNHHYHSTIWWWCASFIAHTHTPAPYQSKSIDRRQFSTITLHFGCRVIALPMIPVNRHCTGVLWMNKNVWFVFIYALNQSESEMKFWQFTFSVYECIKI